MCVHASLKLESVWHTYSELKSGKNRRSFPLLEEGNMFRNCRKVAVQNDQDIV